MKPPFVEAIEFQNANKLKDARRIFTDLMNRDPDNVVLMMAFALNCVGENNNGLAIILFRSALQHVGNVVRDWEKLGVLIKAVDNKAMRDYAKKLSSEIYMGLGLANRNENHVEEARRYFEISKRTMPRDHEYEKRMADILNNEGSLYINEGNPAKGVEIYNEVLRLNPEHKLGRWNLALCQLELFDWSGWDNHDSGDVRCNPINRNYEVPIWDGSKDRIIVTNGEQGIGDEIMFASCVPDLMRDSKRVIFDCHKRLVSIFRASFPELTIHGTREDEWITWPRDYPLEAKVALGSLPKFYRRSWEAFPGTPYIKAPEPGKYREKLDALGPGLKVGISWIGGHKKTRVEVRSIDLKALAPILGQDCHFVSLQYTQHAQQEIDESGFKIHHWPEIVHAEDYGETANLVHDLDLIITVCTSMVHLAGAMGKACWVLTPSCPAWRYGVTGNRMPWYQSVELIRMAYGTKDWKPVIDATVMKLRFLRDEKEQKAA